MKASVFVVFRPEYSTQQFVIPLLNPAGQEGLPHWLPQDLRLGAACVSISCGGGLHSCIACPCYCRNSYKRDASGDNRRGQCVILKAVYVAIHLQQTASN